MKKSLLKLLFLTFLMTMFFGMAVLANETETPENEEIIEEETYYVYDADFSDTFTHQYHDQVNVPHTVKVGAMATASYAWDEGYDGWIMQAYFYLPTVKIDNVTFSVEDANSYGNTSSHYWRTFRATGTNLLITLHLTVDEYGEMYFYATYNV